MDRTLLAYDRALELDLAAHGSLFRRELPAMRSVTSLYVPMVTASLLAVVAAVCLRLASVVVRLRMGLEERHDFKEAMAMALGWRAAVGHVQVERQRRR